MENNKQKIKDEDAEIIYTEKKDNEVEIKYCKNGICNITTAIIIPENIK